MRHVELATDLTQRDLAERERERLQGLRVEDTAAHGALAGDSRDVRIEASQFRRTGQDAILGAQQDLPPSRGLVVQHSLIENSGVLVESDRVTSLPDSNFAAINAGLDARITDNRIVNAGYEYAREQLEADSAGASVLPRRALPPCP